VGLVHRTAGPIALPDQASLAIQRVPLTGLYSNLVLPVSNVTMHDDRYRGQLDVIGGGEFSLDEGETVLE
jgi:hypothetical protein